MRESEERFRATFDHAAVGIAHTRLDGSWLLVNQRLLDLYGYTKEELAQLRFQDITHPDDIETDLAQLDRLLAGEIDSYTLEKRYIRKDGSILWANLTVSLVRDGTGEPKYVIAVVEDIGGRKQAEEALQASEERYRRLVETSPDSILVLDQSGKILLANRRAAELHGYDSPSEMIGMDRLEVLGPDDRRRALENSPTTLETGSVRNREFTLLRKDGSTFPAELSGAFIGDESGTSRVFVSVWRDTSERKRAEEELRESNRRLSEALDELQRTQQQIIQQERLRALGQMASGIAHELNNALQPIAGFSELLLIEPDALDDKEHVRDYLQMIVTATRDAASVVRRVREFYRERQPQEPLQPTNVNGPVGQAIAFTQAKWKDEAMARGIAISIRTDLQDVPMVLGNEAELREALTNLILNAVDAMPYSGTITIGTRAEDRRVVLEVRDTGTGMDREGKKRCFEPFFSTKGSQGTGLGLSIVHGIVQRHGGTVTIESRVGKGTAVIIRLPVAAGEHAQVEDLEPEAQSRRLKLLVVDDEPSVRQIISSLLATDGHEVVTANDGRKGLEKFLSGAFDVVLTDRAMPKMNGDQLAAAIKQISPGTPIVMLTGFSGVMEASGEKPAGVDVIVGKPVTRAMLRQALAQVVAGDS